MRISRSQSAPAGLTAAIAFLAAVVVLIASTAQSPAQMVRLVQRRVPQPNKAPAGKPIPIVNADDELAGLADFRDTVGLDVEAGDVRAELGPGGDGVHVF